MDVAVATQAFSGDHLTHPEEVLLGGLESGRVVKVGDTVRGN
jgi:hypothetical protein